MDDVTGFLSDPLEPEPMSLKISKALAASWKGKTAGNDWRDQLELLSEHMKSHLLLNDKANQRSVVKGHLPAKFRSPDWAVQSLHSRRLRRKTL